MKRAKFSQTLLSWISTGKCSSRPNDGVTASASMTAADDDISINTDIDISADHVSVSSVKLKSKDDRLVSRVNLCACGSCYSLNCYASLCKKLSRTFYQAIF